MQYADPVLDRLDPYRSVAHRLFRESCYNHKGNYVKVRSSSVTIGIFPCCVAFHFSYFPCLWQQPTRLSLLLRDTHVQFVYPHSALSCIPSEFMPLAFVLSHATPPASMIRVVSASTPLRVPELSFPFFLSSPFSPQTFTTISPPRFATLIPILNISSLSGMCSTASDYLCPSESFMPES